MAAILDFSHFCKFDRKSDDSTEFSIPFYINTQGFINEYAILRVIREKMSLLRN